jgi:hypothetical protein
MVEVRVADQNAINRVLFDRFKQRKRISPGMLGVRPCVEDDASATDLDKIGVRADIGKSSEIVESHQ